MNKFRLLINEGYGLQLKDYSDLYEWSTQNIYEFWENIWKLIDPVVSKNFKEVVDDVRKMPGARWFYDCHLNFAENLLRRRDDHLAIIARSEDRPDRNVTYAELFLEVEKVASALRRSGVKKGDRVVGFLPNIPESIITMLAAVSLGAVWSSSSPDFGIKGILDRFRQVKPKILFATEGYKYNGKNIDLLGKLRGVLSALPSVERVVIIPFVSHDPNLQTLNGAVLYKDFLAGSDEHLSFAQCPFDHPLYIMYSSGTTGLPKSIVHGAGGTLVQHMKELRLHCDISSEDTVFYFTTCGWMMWNWLVSNLAIGATIVLYDGSPFYPNSKAMWQMVDDFDITIFGTSAKFIAASSDKGVRPIDTHDLGSIKTILSTGSPLVEEGFDYVYSQVKKDVQLASFSGGTDIISSFVGANPTLPVVRGEIQCKMLGMKVESYNSEGKAVIGDKGELVCTRAFPSMPIYFWNDEDSKKYKHTYFKTFPGVWDHGDFISINDSGGIKILGRSDATLNPSGIRFGTAELYRVVEALIEVEDSLAVGQLWGADERVILFVKMNEKFIFDEHLEERISSMIRSACSPHHVPAVILPIADIPYTINGKKVEIAVKRILMGEEASYRDALSNPESLDLYRDLKELQG